MKRRYAQYLHNTDCEWNCAKLRIVDDLMKCMSHAEYMDLFKQIISSPTLFEHISSKVLELSPNGKKFGLDVWIKLPFGVYETFDLIPLELVDEHSDNIVAVLTDSISDESIFENVIGLVNYLAKRRCCSVDRFYGVLLDNYDRIIKFRNINYTLYNLIPHCFDYYPNLWKLQEKYKIHKCCLAYITKPLRNGIPLSVYHSFVKEDIHNFYLYRKLRFHLSKFLSVSDVISVILKLVFTIQKN